MAERFGEWLHEALSKLSKTRPRRWHAYLLPVFKLHRTLPNPVLQAKRVWLRLEKPE